MMADRRCPVCMEEFNEPKILPCLHIFCKGCLVQQQRFQSSGDSIQCAVCRTASTIPNCDVSRLPNYQISRSLTGADSVSEAGFRREAASSSSASIRGTEFWSSYVKVCSACKDQYSMPAELYCQRCRIFMCRCFVQRHLRIRKNETHDIVNVADMYRSGGTFVTYHLCAMHQHKEASFVCMTCKLLLCDICQMFLHTGHFFVDKVDFINGYTAATKTLQNKAQTRIREFDNYIAFVNEKSRNVNRAISRVKQDITDSYDAAVARLTNERDELLRECLQEEESMYQELRDIADQAGRKRAIVVEKMSAVSNSDEMFMHGQTVPDSSLASDLNSNLDSGGTLDEVRPVKVYSRATDLTFVPNNGIILGDDGILGDLSRTYPVPSSAGPQPRSGAAGQRVSSQFRPATERWQPRYHWSLGGSQDHR